MLTSDAVTAKVISLCQSLSVDASLSLSVMPLARALSRVVGKSDRVIWPQHAGGIAWEVVAAPRALSAGKKSAQKTGRVFWIDFGSLDLIPSLATLPIVRVQLVRFSALATAAPAVFRTPKSPLLLKIGRLLGYRENTEVAESGEFTSSLLDGSDEAVLEASLSKNGTENNTRCFQISIGKDFKLLNLSPDETAGLKPIDSSPLPDAYTQVFADRNDIFPIPSTGFPEERFLMAAAVADAGMIPVLSIASNEAAEAASLTQRLFSGGLGTADVSRRSRGTNKKISKENEARRAIIRIEPGGTAIAFFRSIQDMRVLSPISTDDIPAALRWCFDYLSDVNGPLLIVEPENSLISSRSALKAEWLEGAGVLVKEKFKEKSEDSLARVLFIVPGYLTREAIKAVDRISKKGFSASALALRFLFPVDVPVLERLASGFDIVIVADAFPGTGGLRATLGLAGLFAHSSSLQPIFLNAPSDGKSMAEEAERIHRENRFRRTVDDVKRDQW